MDSYVKNQLDLSDVNRVLELSSIKQFFDKYDHVNGWSDDCYLKNKELSRNVEKEVKSFFLSISENKIVSIYDACEVMFWDEFWKYFYIYKVYEKISMEHFKEIGKVVYLKISYEELEGRLGNLQSRGVALKEGQTLLDLYHERVPYYEKYADITINCSDISIREIVGLIAKKLNK